MLPSAWELCGALTAHFGAFSECVGGYRPGGLPMLFSWTTLRMVAVVALGVPVAFAVVWRFIDLVAGFWGRS